MIESRLDAATDGTGGGYGRYPGLSVEAVAERFRFLVAEGQSRSVRAVLRIAYEQTEARGTIGSQRVAVGLAASVTLALLVARFFVSPETQGQVTIYLGASAAMTLLFALGAATVHRAARRGEAQVCEIHRLALLALDALASKEGFVAPTLEREHLASLQALRRVDRALWEQVSNRVARSV